MKIIAIGSLLSVVISTAAFAQTVTPASAPEDEPQTIVGGRRPGQLSIVSGWFVAPTFGTTGYGGALAYSPGIRGGVYLNRRLAIGLAVNGLGNGDTHIGTNEARNYGTYGGLLLQYVVQSNRLVHVSLESTIGDGRWCVRDNDNDPIHESIGRRFIVFEPAANLEVNVARHVRLTTGVGYRFAVAGSGNGPSGRDMSSLVVRSGLIFGSF